MAMNDEVCREVYQVELEELSRRTASALIDRLQSPSLRARQ
jgi:hypothetical protein